MIQQLTLYFFMFYVSKYNYFDYYITLHVIEVFKYFESPNKYKFIQEITSSCKNKYTSALFIPFFFLYIFFILATNLLFEKKYESTKTNHFIILIAYFIDSVPIILVNSSQLDIKKIIK